ncbi:NlpC/P60 family protein [Patulibacter sp. NPDC049589]|uniref:NlpC/P60 family protein n=1 Tax=Patulibacter sp. NPDC049589 TaxID=3154731 RepID=UPI0034391B83
MKQFTRGIVLAATITLGALPASAMAQSPSGGTPATPPAAAAAPAPASTSPDPDLAVRTVKLTRSQTKSVQRRVKVRPDGALGAGTRTALKRYQRARQLVPTGRPNLQTLRAMELKFAAAIEEQLKARADLPASAPASAAAQAVQAAMSQAGTPYSFGGDAPGGFDCSGLTMWAYAQAGVKLPHYSFDQFAMGEPVERDAIQPGDLVFFDTAGPGASDVGIATGPTTVVSATSSRGVLEHETFDDYWGAHYVGARRLVTAN